MNLTTAHWLNKVPEVTLSFWLIKILSTTVGETGADFLAVDVGLGAAITTLGMTALRPWRCSSSCARARTRPGSIG